MRFIRPASGAPICAPNRLHQEVHSLDGQLLTDVFVQYANHPRQHHKALRASSKEVMDLIDALPAKIICLSSMSD